MLRIKSIYSKKNCLRIRIIIQTLAKHTNAESMSRSPRRLAIKYYAVYEYTTRTVHTPPIGEHSLGCGLTLIGVYHPQEGV